MESNVWYLRSPHPAGGPVRQPHLPAGCPASAEIRVDTRLGIFSEQGLHPPAERQADLRAPGRRRIAPGRCGSAGGWSRRTVSGRKTTPALRANAERSARSRSRNGSRLLPPAGSCRCPPFPSNCDDLAQPGFSCSRAGLQGGQLVVAPHQRRAQLHKAAQALRRRVHFVHFVIPPPADLPLTSISPLAPVECRSHQAGGGLRDQHAARVWRRTAGAPPG